MPAPVIFAFRRCAGPQSLASKHLGLDLGVTTWRRGLHASGVLGSHDKSGSGSSRLLVYPGPSSTKHHDLPSFLQYAERSGLDPQSPTYVGTRYEYSVASSLRDLGFSLQRVGGSSDYGIDLLGTWSVPSSPEPIRVLVQCKALSQKIGPHLIRELEGAFVGAPAGWRGPGVVGLMVTEKPATKGVRDSMGRSRWPMAFVSCSRTGRVQQMLWNQRAGEEGLEGLGVGTRYSEKAGDEARLVLMWKGKHILPTQSASEPGEVVRRSPDVSAKESS